LYPLYGRGRPIPHFVPAEASNGDRIGHEPLVWSAHCKATRASASRFRLTPALGKAIAEGRTYPAFLGLRLSLILELSLAAAILGLVAWLGTLEPPVSM
jgi:hypothetical protein